MTALTVADSLKFANLQIAAEAFLLTDEDHPKPKSGSDLIAALVDGNNRSLKFTQTQAEAFSDEWEVVAQKANTATGFSGTLFRNKAHPGELVLSFRSTEFIHGQRAAIIH